MLERQQGLPVPLHKGLRIPKALLPDAVILPRECETCLRRRGGAEFEDPVALAVEDRLVLEKCPNKRRAKYCREIFHLLSCFSFPIGSRRGGILTGGGEFFCDRILITCNVDRIAFVVAKACTLR